MVNVSVIIPVYNCQKFLKHSVQSVLNQTYKNWELIIVDDASTDGSLSEARRLAEDNPKIKVFALPENKGVSACRNFAISKAQGRYLAFLDSDDLWAKNKLAAQLMFMQQKKAALSHTTYSFIDEKGRVMEAGKVEVDECINLPTYMKTTQIGMSTVMIDRQKIGAVHFPNDRELCEDARTWMHFLRKGQQFYGLNIVSTLYRVRKNQLSKNKAKMAQCTLKRYWNERNLPAYKRLYYFVNYACNGFLKRMRPTKISPEIIAQFNCNQR